MREAPQRPVSRHGPRSRSGNAPLARSTHSSPEEGVHEDVHLAQRKQLFSLFLGQECAHTSAYFVHFFVSNRKPPSHTLRVRCHKNDMAFCVKMF